MKKSDKLFRITYCMYGVGAPREEKPKNRSKKYPSYLQKGKTNKSARGW